MNFSVTWRHLALHVALKIMILPPLLGPYPHFLHHRQHFIF
jgi:hypothetical protein